MDDDDLKRLLESGAVETRRHFDAALERVEGKMDESVVEMRRHFDVTAERLDRKIDAVAESVAILDEKLDRRIDDVEQRMDRGFAETQAMIKFSHAELDRRVA